MLDIETLTVKEIKQIQSLMKKEGEKSPHPYQVGQNYFIRTVTHHFTGKLIRVTRNELVLQDAAWIADDGRFFDCIKDGKINEFEGYQDDVIIGRGSLIDCTIWKHNLPRGQK